ncbi:major allergen Pru ar 1-like [Dorcoceras hygrometricum]|uniref:Major allergen Pru ar 1-like n=1 Tax=Dorcoceras hygrometricum TaxID=472368 RepID=A0A2Z7AMA7_9LAMI|nr:major allergen Pru ar 1-like [Dorcoceras hygrometricum]
MTVVEVSNELKVKISPERMFKAVITNAHNVLPKMLPHIFKSIEVLEGEGGTVGCVRKLSFTDVIPFSHLKDKFDAVDTKHLEAKIDLFEGPMLGEKLESMYSEKRFVDSGDGGCIIKWKHHLHLKPGHTHVTEEEFKGQNEFSTTFLTAVEAYLLAHPEVCA